MDSEDIFQAALKYYQEGNLSRSETICQQITSADSMNHDALLLLGMIHFQLGKFESSASYIKQSIQSNSGNPYAFFNLGNAFRELGHTEEAIHSFKKAIELDRFFTDAYYNLAQIFKEKGNLDEAILLYKKSIENNQDQVDVYNNLGEAYRQKGMLDEAAEILSRALLIDPDYVPALSNLGMVYSETGQLEESLLNIQRAIRIDPESADLYYNMGIILEKKEELDEAEDYFRKSIALNPAFADVYSHLGILYKNRGWLDRAVKFLREALSKFPKDANLWNNLGMVLEEKGSFDRAIHCFLKAINLNPRDPEIHWNLSLILLLTGRFKEGWNKYEWRFLIKEFAPRSFPQPQWDGRLSLKGKSLFVHAEQGLGDEVMFASCLPDILKEACDCIIECDRRLVPIYRRSFAGSTVTERIQNGMPFPDKVLQADLRIAVGTLPKYFRPDFDSFLSRTSYLIPDEEKVAIWRARLDSLGKGPKIGISWRGGRTLYEKEKRSVPLEAWEDILSLQGVVFINLQYGNCAEDLQKLKEKTGTTVHHWQEINPLRELDNFTSLMAALDLVISVDNTNVHLAGALGVPVWTLLSFASEWRWMSEIEDSPWYPSMKILRQKNPGDWNSVFMNLSSNLRHYINTGTLPETERANFRTKPFHKLKQARKNNPPSRAESSPLHTRYRCAVVTPVGPGHEKLYKECLASVINSSGANGGKFAEIIPFPIDDPHGKLGRSRARNLGIKKAAEQGIEWIFFIDADDFMAPLAFEYVSPYLDEYDGIWGAIWPIEKGEPTPKERPYQLPFLLSINDVLSCDPFVTLGIGHFVKTSIAVSTPFDEKLDTGEDFDYYLRVWKNQKCIKIPLPFSYYRRGYHSLGPRSATGRDWREQVEKIFGKYQNIFSMND